MGFIFFYINQLVKFSVSIDIFGGVSQITLLCVNWTIIHSEKF